MAAALAKTALTDKQKLQVMLDNGIAESEARTALATAAHSATNVVAAGTTGLLTKATSSLKVALKGLWTTLKANPLILVASAITVAVTAFNALSQAEENASEKYREEAKASIEKTQGLNEERDRIDELIDKYKELKDAEYIDADTREEIRDIQKEINSLVDGETEGLDLVNGKLDEQLEKLMRIKKEEAERNTADYIAAYSNSSKSSDNAYVSDRAGAGWAEFIANLSSLDVIVKGYDEAAQSILNEIDGVKVIWDSNIIDELTSIHFDVDGAQEYYDVLTKCIKALEDDPSYYHQNSAVYNSLVGLRKEYEGFIATQDQAANDLVNNIIAIEDASLYLAGKTVDSAKAYNEYRDALIANVMANEDLSQVFKDGRASRYSVGMLVDDVMLENFGSYENFVKSDKLLEIESKLISESTSKSVAEDIRNELGELSDEELEIAYRLVGEADYKSFSDLKAEIDNVINTGSTTTYDPYIEYTSIVEKYSKYVDKFNKAMSDLGADKIGNIDLRDVWYFTSSDFGSPGFQANLMNNLSAFTSWASYDEMPGYMSSAYGFFDEYNGLKLAITPYIWTEDSREPEILGKDTIHDYLDLLIEKAGNGYSYEDILKLDAIGFEVDGIHIKGVIADIGDSAEETSEKLQNISVNDALLKNYRNIMNDKMAEAYKSVFDDLWSSEKFAETKATLVEMSKTIDGISPDGIEELAKESEELAEILELDGINAKFLANILQAEIASGTGFEMVTDDTLRLSTALEGMTRQFDEIADAKSRYDAAMSAGEKDDDFKSYAEAFKELNNQFVAGTTNSNAFWAAAEYIFGADQLQEWGWSDGIDEIYAAMQKNVGVFGDADSAGAGFLDRLYQISEGGKVIGEDGSVIAEIQKFADGSYEFDIDGLHLDELADQMGLSKESVLSCLKALSMWGDVDYYDMSEVLDAIKDIGLSSDDFSGTAVNVSALTDQLITLGYTNKEIYELLDALKEVEGVELLSVDADLGTLTESLSNLGLATGEVGDIKINVDGLMDLMQSLNFTKEEAQALANKLSEADGITLVNASGDAQSLDAVLSNIEARSFATVDSGISQVDSELQNASSSADTLYAKLQKIDGTVVTIAVKYNVKSSILSSLGLDGFAKGTDNAPDGAALVGENGEELVQSGDKAYFVGTNGAEIVSLNKGDRVYTAEETRRIKRNKNGIRGVLPAYSGGYHGGASGTISQNSFAKRKSSSGSSKDSSEDKLKVFDWIEVAIDRIENAISRLVTTATSAYKSLKTKLGATADEIELLNREIVLQQKAYERYMREANSVGLSSDLAKLVQEGTIDISKYDEDTQKLIDDYIEWYNKAIECSDAVQDLHENLAELYEDNFNNVKDDFDNQIDLLEHLSASYESGIDTLEEKGYLESTKYYAALQDVEHKHIGILKSELTSLEQLLSDAMVSGEIEKYSEAWYGMQGSINDVKEELADANLSLIEYANMMHEIEWSHFDYIQERISRITKESDFLVELLSNSDLFDDTGRMTDAGKATVGLHGLNYDTYMSQADQYASELEKVNRQLSEDPYNTDIIERREELLDLQQESILAAEAEKQAIIDLAKEGIELELESIKELIDTYTDALDSAKDLYDYQKKTQSHTDTISNIEKQLSAYGNDFSEETRAKVQQLQVDLQDAKEQLEETEYEQYVNDQKKLLDDLFLEYETVLNQRLDNVDLLFDEMIGSVNTNSALITDTLIREAGNVGYNLTDAMRTIWDGSVAAIDGTLAIYGDDFDSKLTSINYVLGQIHANTAAMVFTSDAIAENTVGDIKKYKTGGLVNYTGLAHLDGTPSKPELVLNAQDTANFIALKETLQRMTEQRLTFGTSYGSAYVQQLSGITDISKKIASIRDVSDINAGINVGDTQINIQIDHVEDYNDFVAQLQKDKQFEHFVQSMTVDRLVGGTSLKKNKYQFSNR